MFQFRLAFPYSLEIYMAFLEVFPSSAVSNSRLGNNNGQSEVLENPC